MLITRETLLRIARETSQRRVFSEPEIVAVYLTGSLRSENPFLGGSTDVDMVIVHPAAPPKGREIVPLNPAIHLDISHRARAEYAKPKELRVDPWLGPELYDPLPLYGSQHFFEFVQAGVRAEYNEPVNIICRARKCAENARQVWSGLQSASEKDAGLLPAYLKCIHVGANAVALLAGSALTERRFMLQFRDCAGEASVPGLAETLLALLGGNQADGSTLRNLLQGWEEDFRSAASRKSVHPTIAAPRLLYYRQAFEALLAGDFPQSILYPLLHTWVLSAAALPPESNSHWQAACETLGLAGAAMIQKLEGLDRFLETIEKLLEDTSSSQGL